MNSFRRLEKFSFGSSVIFKTTVGFDVLWPQNLALLALGLVVMTFAVSRFHKTIS